MSSSDSSEEEEYLFFSERLNFADVEPVPQNDGPHPVIQIAYTDRFKDAYDYFRAIYAKNEYSDRVMELTNECIKQNPANYTVWEYRRNNIINLNLDISKELEFTKKVMGNNPKNYQMWHHRASLIKTKEKITAADIQKEINVINHVLANDCKNYHAWQHRISLLKDYSETINIDNEVLYTKKLIDENYRNNSAWNYLHTIYENNWKDFDFDWLMETVLPEDIDSHDVYNESVWSFLGAILEKKDVDQKIKDRIYKRVVDVYQKFNAERESLPHTLVHFLLDNYKAQPVPIISKSDIKSSIEKLKETDSIRVKYWNYILQTCF